MSDGFALGPVYIRYFGIITMLGVLAGAWLTAYLTKRRGEDADFVWDMLVNLIIGGLIGARIWHIFTPTNSSIDQGLTTYFYFTHPLDILAIWDGGLGVIGALIGGVIALWIYARNNQLDFVEWADLFAPGMALGQAVGRIADYFNQQLYGFPTDLPWKIFIETSHRLKGYESIGYYHPLFAYEVILNITNFALLFFLLQGSSNKFKTGNILILYVLNYSLIRWGLEFLRLDVSRVAGYNINQVVVFTSALLATAMLYYRQKQTNL